MSSIPEPEPLSIPNDPSLRERLIQENAELMHLDLGWRKNPEGTARIVASLPHPGVLSAAAPSWMGDGMTGDLMPYLAYYESEAKNPDGTVWKAKEDEPPYRPQVGNNCTSRGLVACLDLLQFCTIADPPADSRETIVFIRCCVEAAYAFGLSKAGMRGDNGCYGSAVAAGAYEIGSIPYTEVDGVDEEERARLVKWSSNPKVIVDQYGPKAAAFKVGNIAKVTTFEECCAAIANRALITVASNVGYVGSRDAKGIIRRRGNWAHQMAYVGVIRSDGVESLVQVNSWGKNNPTGPQPFRLPSFSWRVVREDVEAQLQEGDSWAIRLFPGFVKTPLPDRWTNKGWAG